MSSLVWPNGTKTEPTRTSGYGPRTPIKTTSGTTRPFHVGQDWIGIGDLKSIGDGTVVEEGTTGWSGWYVLIYLGEIDGTRTWVRYCHLAKRSHLRRGRTVRRGDLVGIEGATGQVTGKHLHMEIYRGRIDRGTGKDPGSTTDPRAFIQARLTTTKGTKVRHYARQDPTARGKGRTLKPGEHLYLNTKQGVKNDQATNVVGTVGPYSITPHVYAEGAPGEGLELTLIWQATRVKPPRNSQHYVERITFDKDGLIRASREFKRAVAAGDAVYVRVNSLKSNKKNIKLTLLDCDSYLFI